ncbi:MAG: VanZ family protein [Flavobacteriales bacterium]|jgi:VanZ family protein|nr:VanZ family protein [Flavobacteriales bacterium]MBK6550692.1 VanZ family protein [Flavobacteriales bacterium]MBK6883761.1 VanZ family protein [Flavobacteriales bacterium]MBK7103316.1 VanZ family protein [Flavobacteriales bacterium]MBK7112703.1 VanZ family protein [Flavobacteriales bacterium]
MHHYRLAALAWALLIAFLCLTPGKALPEWEWADLLSVDKAIHALIFGVFAVLLAFGLRERAAWTESRILWTACLGSVAYGGLMEVLQEIPDLGRQGDWVDLTANTVGAVLGLIWTRRRWNRQRHTIHREVA